MKNQLIGYTTIGTQVKRINKMTLKEGKRKFVGKAA